MNNDLEINKRLETGMMGTIKSPPASSSSRFLPSLSLAPPLLGSAVLGGALEGKLIFASSRSVNHSGTLLPFGIRDWTGKDSLIKFSY